MPKWYNIPNDKEFIRLSKEEFIVEEWSFICDLLGFDYEKTEEIIFSASDIRGFGELKEPWRHIENHDLIQIKGGPVYEVTYTYETYYEDNTQVYYAVSYDIQINVKDIVAIYKKNADNDGFYQFWKKEDK